MRLVILSLMIGCLGGNVCSQELALHVPAEVMAFPEKWDPPFIAVESRAYGDGGTLGIKLRDQSGSHLLLTVSQDTWDDSTVPGNTLFLEAWHPDDISARLPRNIEELAFVKGAIESAVRDKFSDKEVREFLDDGKRIEEEWGGERHDAHTALYAWDKVLQVEDAAVLDTNKPDSAPPWWRAYDDERQQTRRDRERRADISQRFLECFPPETHSALDYQSGWAMVVPGLEDGRVTEDEEILRRAKLVTESFDDPVDLSIAVLRALDILGGDWRVVTGRDHVAITSLQLAPIDSVTLAIDQLHSKGECTLGISRALCTVGLSQKLSDESWVQLALPTLTNLLDNFNELEDPDIVLRTLRRRDLPEAHELLNRIADEEVGNQGERSSVDK